MTDLKNWPERLFFPPNQTAITTPFDGGVEYVRADLAKPKVKPLVWEYHPAGAIAGVSAGHAYIIDTRTKGKIYSIKGFYPNREFSSLDEAKAAAQADYERRILSALEGHK